jgi:hypothetical protein
MPNAYDRQRLTITHSPVEKVDTAFGKLPDLFSPEQILEQVKEFIEQLLFPAIEELTGIDLSAFLPTIEAVFDALTTLFGDLNPLSGTFNPLDAVTTFIELMVEVGANLPMALIQELTGFTGGVPILSQLIGLFTGTTGGLTGLGGLGAIFGDLTGLLGNPTALGSGTPVLGSLSSIPILGPLFGLFGGASNATQATNFFTSITSLFGNPAGLLTGSPTVPALGSIPILGPLITGLLSGGQGVNGINIFGSLFPGVVPSWGRAMSGTPNQNCWRIRVSTPPSASPVRVCGRMTPRQGTRRTGRRKPSPTVSGRKTCCRTRFRLRPTRSSTWGVG